MYPARVGVLIHPTFRRRRRLTPDDDDGYDDEELFCDARDDDDDARVAPRGTPVDDEDAKRDA